MTFALHAITITNFRSYKGTHKFKFPTKEGIYYLTGENLVEDIGANGAGKTTFMDAIVWCLYGATSRGLKATDVLPDWETPGCKVRLELTVGDRRATITRTQKPNNLTLDDKIVDQVELEKYLRLNQSAFLNSVLNAQFGQPFFSLSASEKLSLFSDINGLEKWLDYSKAAADKANTLESQMAELHNKEVRLQENIKNLKADITNLETEAEGFEGSRKKRCEVLEDEFVANDLKARKLVKREEECIKHLQDVERRRLNQVLEAKELEKQRDEALQVLEKSAIEKRLAEANLKEVEAEIVRLKELKGNVECPYCFSELSDGHISTHLNNLQANRRFCENSLTHHTEAHKRTVKRVFEKKVQIDSAQLKVSEFDIEFSKAEKKYEAVRDEIDELTKRNKQIEKELDNITAEKNPFKKLITQKEASLGGATAQLKQVSAELTATGASHASNVYWVKGFKRVRLYIIEQVFQALEVEVNNCLTQLGMQDWQITFDIERENKSGGVTKGFMVFVKSPRNKAPVKWENWSGGETQRLQLAGDLALANLIMHQAGLKNTIEFFDEPSTHLSTQGMLDFANLLHERALSDGKCIWIIDHAAISNFGEFEAVITVRKDSNGSQITTTA